MRDPGDLGPWDVGSGGYRTWMMEDTDSPCFWQGELWPNLDVPSPAEMMSAPLPPPKKAAAGGKFQFCGAVQLMK